MLAATAIAVNEHGYVGLAVRHVIEGAGVSRATFYEHFTNKQQVVLAAYDRFFARLLEEIEAACAAQAEWASKVRASIAAALRLAAAEPEAAALLSVHTTAAGREGIQRVLGSHEHFAALLAQGRPAKVVPAATERTLVGAIWTMVAADLICGEPEHLSELEPHLVELTLLPFLGAAEARRRSR